MAEPFKNVFNKEFFTNFTTSIQSINSRFDADSFLKSIFIEDWEEKELKQRMRHATIVLNEHLEGDFTSKADLIIQLIPTLQAYENSANSLAYLFLPDFIEVYGIDDFETSFKAFETITPLISCEFAVRPFILKYEKEAIKQMTLWTRHKNHHLRRLASEGSRSRLPWGMAIPSFKKDPSPVLPILDALKNDASEYVRKSVANNLNDVSKDNPELYLEILKKWSGKTNNTDKILKHASRTLLKQGNQTVLVVFGLGASDSVIIENFKIDTPAIQIGDYLAFSFDVLNKEDSARTLRLEYAVYYQKANQTLSKKVYKISEKEYPKLSKTSVNRRQSFKPITTRVFHHGLHKLSIIINGKEFELLDFQLVVFT